MDFPILIHFTHVHTHTPFNCSSPLCCSSEAVLNAHFGLLNSILVLSHNILQSTYYIDLPSAPPRRGFWLLLFWLAMMWDVNEFNRCGKIHVRAETFSSSINDKCCVCVCVCCAAAVPREIEKVNESHLPRKFSSTSSSYIKHRHHTAHR